MPPGGRLPKAFGPTALCRGSNELRHFGVFKGIEAEVKALGCACQGGRERRVETFGCNGNGDDCVGGERRGLRLALPSRPNQDSARAVQVTSAKSLAQSLARSWSTGRLVLGDFALPDLALATNRPADRVAPARLANPSPALPHRHRAGYRRRSPVHCASTLCRPCSSVAGAPVKIQHASVGNRRPFAPRQFAKTQTEGRGLGRRTTGVGPPGAWARRWAGKWRAVC